MKIEEIIKEEGSFRVEFFSELSRMYLGRILIKNHSLVACEFDRMSGLNALKKYLQLSDFQNYPLILDIQEEESIRPRKIEFTLNLDEFLRFKRQMTKIHETAVKFKPPLDKYFRANPKILHEVSKISHLEFDVLSSILDHKRIDAIYEAIPIFEDDITMAFVSLKKQGIISLES